MPCGAQESNMHPFLNQTPNQFPKPQKYKDILFIRFGCKFDFCHVARRYVNQYFQGVLQDENKDRQEKQYGSKYLLNYCFINLLVNYLLHAAPYAIYR